MKKIALIGNCQSTALSNFFKRVNEIEVVSLLDINCQGTPDFERDKYRLLNSNDIDFVLSQPLSDAFNNLSSSFLREKFKDRFISYTNIFFTGLHPDLSYFGDFNQRINSPLGDYHSKLALTAFAKNMSITECLDLYCQEIYEKMYYFSCFENSQIELINRDINNEIKFSRDFFELARQELPLYAVNHPTKIVIEKLGKKILSHLECDANLGSSFFIDPFISSTIWPVYEEVGKMHNLPYSTSMLFLPQVESGMKALDLQELVVRSFEKYRSVGHKDFMKIGLAQELEAIPL